MKPSDEPISPEMQAQLDHIGGKHVVVEYVYADGKGTRFLLESLDDDSDAVALWSDLAFSNGPALGEIRMRWDKALADELRKEFAEREVSDEEPAPW